MRPTVAQLSPFRRGGQGGSSAADMLRTLSPFQKGGPGGSSAAGILMPPMHTKTTPQPVS